MTDNELAWIAREYASGRKQVDIANEIGVSPGKICTCIAQFCQHYGYGEFYRDTRRVSAYTAVQYYQGNFTRPVIIGLAFDPVLSAARYEHAWLLRAEGHNLSAIGERLGVTKERARQMILRQGRKVTRAIRYANFIVEA
jgi:hypothetical protein